jgi:hypothetical protein
MGDEPRADISAKWEFERFKGLITRNPHRPRNLAKNVFLYRYSRGTSLTICWKYLPEEFPNFFSPAKLNPRDLYEFMAIKLSAQTPSPWRCQPLSDE